tara:strand:+ start:225 stop:896 length:672 start_codon:yes stop_codon:yes gene_type:complete
LNHLINTNAKVIRDEIYGKPYFIIDDFFVNPDSVYKQYFKKLGDLHRKGEENSLNEIFFIDRRKEVRGYIVEEINKIVKYLTNQSPASECFFTNETLFFDEPFNDTEKNWWWMHIDHGYNMIIYMTKKGDSCGTNLYSPEDYYSNNIHYGNEHVNPWIPKEKIRPIKHLEGKYNRLVLFDGKIPHGMNLVKGKFINKYRRNIVGFYADYLDYLRFKSMLNEKK